jgi:hypothetical protein
MDLKNQSFKSSPLFGIFTILFSLFFVIVLFPYLLSSESSDFYVVLILVICCFVLVFIGYLLTGTHKVILDGSGITYMNKKEIEFSARWDEISKIKSYKFETIDSTEYIIRIYVKRKDYFEFGMDPRWRKRIKKRIFREMVKRADEYEIRVIDELHWDPWYPYY